MGPGGGARQRTPWALDPFLPGLVLNRGNRGIALNNEEGFSLAMGMESTHKLGKIMVAFDGSSDSEKAVRMAAMLAGGFRSELVVVHIYSSPVLAYSGAGAMPVPNYAELEDAAKDGGQKVLAKGVQLAKDSGVAARGELLEGSSTVQALVEYSAAEKVDLLVLGTRGNTGFKKLVLGSVSSGVVNHSSCPVLVVR